MAIARFDPPLAVCIVTPTTAHLVRDKIIVTALVDLKVTLVVMRLPKIEIPGLAVLKICKAALDFTEDGWVVGLIGRIECS